MDFAPQEVPITNPMGPVNNADGTPMAFAQVSTTTRDEDSNTCPRADHNGSGLAQITDALR